MEKMSGGRSEVARATEVAAKKMAPPPPPIVSRFVAPGCGQGDKESLTERDRSLLNGVLRHSTPSMSLRSELGAARNGDSINNLTRFRFVGDRSAPLRRGHRRRPGAAAAATVPAQPQL